MSVESRVTTTELPPTEAVPATDDTGAALVPAPTGRKAPKEPKAAKPPRERRPKSPGRTTLVILRRMDPWSVLKLSIVYYLAVFLVILVAGVLLWAGATSIGAIENIESFMVDIGFDDFKFVGSKILSGLALGGLVLVVAGTVANVLLCALFNLMGDVTGGLRLTLQEDVARPPKSKRGRRHASHALEGETPAEPTV